MSAGSKANSEGTLVRANQVNNLVNNFWAISSNHLIYIMPFNSVSSRLNYYSYRGNYATNLTNNECILFYC